MKTFTPKPVAPKPLPGATISYDLLMRYCAAHFADQLMAIRPSSLTSARRLDLTTQSLAILRRQLALHGIALEG